MSGGRRSDFCPEHVTHMYVCATSTSTDCAALMMLWMLSPFITPHSVDSVCTTTAARGRRRLKGLLDFAADYVCISCDEGMRDEGVRDEGVREWVCGMFVVPVARWRRWARSVRRRRWRARRSP